MQASVACRWLAVSILSFTLAACGDNAMNAPPTTVPVAQQPAPSATQVAPTDTTLPTATAPSTATAPPTASPQPSATATVQPTATVLPAATATIGVVLAPTATLPPTSGENAPVEGRYFFPVQGAQVEYDRAHHDYPAADIFCPIGSQFVAPTDGAVDYVSREDVWDPATNKPQDRGGISVAIIGDDGVRYYGSHLSEVADGIEVGARVAAGQLLGLTGKSGNARSTPPHLHFGISRPTTPDDWQVRRGEVAPYDYLRAWQRGEQVRPRV